MSGKLIRYQIDEVLDHLASNYVLGTLSVRVRNRIERLRKDTQHQALDQRIQYWEKQLSPLNQKTPELQPHKVTWTQLNARINSTQDSNKSKPYQIFFNLNLLHLATACSFVLLTWIAITTFSTQSNPGPLSYVAILSDSAQQPKVVAATYGDSQTLMLDIVSLPKIAAAQTFELWVTSKSDQQIRSLGEVPINLKSFRRKLSDAEWRLIKDSDTLMISIEEAGGSSIGEPMGRIVSQGVCVRLSAWQKQNS